MPPLPNVTGVAKFLMQATDSVRAYENVFHIQKGDTDGLSAWTASDLSTTAETVFTSYHTAFINKMHNDFEITGCIGQALDGTETMGSYYPGSPVSGSDSGNGFTAQTAVCISWPVPAAYRGGHFRSYIAGITDTNKLNAQEMTSAQAVQWANGASEFQSAINAAMLGDFPLFLVGVSYYRDKALREPPVVFEFGVPSVDQRYASQRRRLGKLSGGSRSYPS